MRLSISLAMISLIALAVSTADAATITGTVKGPDGQAFRGAFVQARNAKTKITVNVLSDNQGAGLSGRYGQCHGAHAGSERHAGFCPEGELRALDRYLHVSGHPAPAGG